MRYRLSLLASLVAVVAEFTGWARAPPVQEEREVNIDVAALRMSVAGSAETLRPVTGRR